MLSHSKLNLKDDNVIECTNYCWVVSGIINYDL